MSRRILHGLGVIRSILKSDMLSHIMFWGWNMMFFAMVFVGLLPLVLVQIVEAAIDGTVPFDLALTASLLLVVPVAASAAGARLTRDPAKLSALFFGVEGPVMLLLFFRLLLLRQLNPATTFMLVVFLVGAFGYAYGIYRTASESRGAFLAARLAVHTVCLWLGVYLAIFAGIYAMPLALKLIIELFSFSWAGSLLDALSSPVGLLNLLFGFFALLFALASMIVFISLPATWLLLYPRRWRETYVVARSAFGSSLAVWVTVGVLVALTTGFAAANRQPQHEAYDALASAPSTDAERRALLEDEDGIRRGLLNAYLAPYRYVASTQKGGVVKMLYEQWVYLPEPLSDWVQSFHNVFAAPFLYQAKDGPSNEQRDASNAYADFFDVPIQKGEKGEILSALTATYDSDGREAGLLNEGQQKVHVERQEVLLDEHEMYADIEIHEVYRNLTPVPQEIFYYFTLPPSAVVTGLWLGDTDDRSKRFPFVVATRGAAQEVYRTEVQRSADPALVEQIGPAQYRLRAYPVPPRPSEDFGLVSPVRPTVLHLWLSVKVLPEDGGWPLPRLGERRHVFTDRRTERFVNGTPRMPDSHDDWLPPFVAASRPPLVRAQTFTFSGGAGVRVEPLAGDVPLPTPGHTYAIIVDRSRSMGRHAADLEASLSWLFEHVMGASDVDLYLTSAATRGESATRIDEPAGFDASKIVFFGGQDPAEMLEQFDALRENKPYDAIVVLTDDGAFDLARDRGEGKIYDAPLWMVHVGGRLPPGYADSVVETITRSGGGVTTRVGHAMQNLGLAERWGGDGTFFAFEDGYVFSLTRGPTAEADGVVVDGVVADGAATDGAGADGTAPDGVGAHRGRSDAHALAVGFAPLAARVLVRAGERAFVPGTLDARDRLHAIAKRFGIVTSLSSMLVLVNDEQRDALAHAEAEDDRFDREIETGEEVLSTPFGGFTAVPEPETWMLIVVSCLIIGLIAKRQRSGCSLD
ncbi:MAG: TIGR02921 family PEP-CTERM protein [Deltaproteobacteria bacterium]|nr:TIGR02921 family PEP-CTERM protein [Deltaproteobacteria bacterium]